MIRVVVADEFPAVRRGVVAVLGQQPEMEVIGEATDAREARDVVEHAKPSVLVLDLSMRGVRGLELVRELREKYPSMGILVYGTQRESQLGIASLKAGASGFLSKRATEDELVRAIRTAAEGRRYLSPELTEHVIRELPQPVEAPPHFALSERELDVLCLLAEGKKASEIAKLLGVSAKTVHSHRGRILEKLELQTTVDLVLYAVEHHLVALNPGAQPGPDTR